MWSNLSGKVIIFKKLKLYTLKAHCNRHNTGQQCIITRIRLLGKHYLLGGVIILTPVVGVSNYYRRSFPVVDTYLCIACMLLLFYFVVCSYIH